LLLRRKSSVRAARQSEGIRSPSEELGVGVELRVVVARENLVKGDGSVQNGGNNQGDIQKSDLQRADRISTAKLEPMAVTVETNLDKAMKILKRKLIKEGLFKELKTRRYFEKPSEKKKRKMKETMKKLRKEEARARKNNML
jgi:small subunit ribosomal protein S21